MDFDSNFNLQGADLYARSRADPKVSLWDTVAPFWVLVFGKLQGRQRNAGGMKGRRTALAINSAHREMLQAHCKQYMQMGHRTISTLWSISREAGFRLQFSCKLFRLQFSCKLQYSQSMSKLDECRQRHEVFGRRPQWLSASWMSYSRRAHGEHMESAGALLDISAVSIDSRGQCLQFARIKTFQVVEWRLLIIFIQKYPVLQHPQLYGNWTQFSSHSNNW